MRAFGEKSHRFGPKTLPLDLSSHFIRRPVATTLLTIAITLAGMVAFGLLPVAPLPAMDFPVVMVQASLPGAGPETMAATVATPLERALGRIAGVTEMTSSSSLGSARITLQFDLSRNVDGAARDVQSSINAARSTLPTMPSNPKYRKFNPSAAPIMILSITSDVLSRAQLYDAASTVLAQKISQIPGVGEVTVGGGAMPAVRVELSPDALNRMGVSAEAVRRAISGANAFLPKGVFENDRQTWIVGASDQLSEAADYRRLIVATNGDRTVRLDDVAEVVDSSQDIRNMALANGRPSILLIIFRASGANIIETVDRVKALLPQLRAWLPETAELSLEMDRSTTIRASLHEVEKSLSIAVGLVVLVTFLFLRNARATVIPAVAAPVSLVATFSVMYLLDYSLDNLSLMALTVSTGFVVDDAIVVLENCMRHLEAGGTPFRAAMRGAREVGFTVISISFSLVAVFVPILFLGGVLGMLFREFAVVLTCAVLFSMLVSLTTTPMMCASLLKPVARGEGGVAPAGKLPEEQAGPLRHLSARIGGWWGGMLQRLQEGYAKSLAVVLHHPRMTLLVLLLVIVCNVALFVFMSKGFFPTQDTGVIMGGLRTDQSASFQSMNAKLRRLMQAIKDDPAVESVTMHFSGNRGGGGVFIALKPLEERGLPVQAVIGRLRGKLMREPGVQIFLQPAQDIMMGGRSSRSQYQYTVQGDDLVSVRQWGRRLQQAFAQDPIFTDVDSDIEERGLQTMLTINRDRLAQLGLSVRDVDAALNDAFGQRQVSTIYREKNQYRVVMEYSPEWLESEESLKKVYLPGRDGLVPLSSVASVAPGFAPLSVAHQGQFAAVTISFNLAKGATLEDARRSIAEMRVRIGVPSTLAGGFQGTARMFAQNMGSQGLLILTALAILYIVLGVLYESLIHPLTILSTLPSAGVGALLALILCGKEFSVIALIGVLLLAGIVKKNAIMMVDFALDASRTRKLSPEKAISEACRLRFRPILMTTAAAIFGAVPLALGQGDGAELRQPLGITIVGGLIVSQLLTLYTTPVVYLCLDRLRLRFIHSVWRQRYGERRAHLLAVLNRHA